MAYQPDLFGDVKPPKTKSRDDDYRDYMDSPKWKQKRALALERAKNKCEVCGLSKWSVTLEVHHKTYERFKNERLEDLLVVCKNCHKEKDLQRQRETKSRNLQALMNARFDGWLSKKFNCEDCSDYYSDDLYSDDLYEEFLDWIEKKEID